MIIINLYNRNEIFNIKKVKNYKININIYYIII